MKLIEFERIIVRKYLPVPYVLRGRDTLSGLDCYGLMINIYRDIGFKLIDIEEEYNEEWSWKGKNHFVENYHDQWKRVSSPAFLDVVLFKNSKGVANHGGVILTVGKFIHCSKSGVNVSRLNDQQWENRIEGFYHLKARHDQSC